MKFIELYLVGRDEGSISIRIDQIAAIRGFWDRTGREAAGYSEVYLLNGSSFICTTKNSYLQEALTQECQAGFIKPSDPRENSY